MSGPRERFVTANRLRLHLLEWGEVGPIVLCLHGFLEHAHAFDLLAPHLAAAGHHVFALDWRGHGDSDRVGAGGYYHFPDYIADLSALVRELGEKVSLVAHSMGGSAALLYAGTEPERVTSLSLIEGIGPPASSFEEAPARFAEWMADLDRVANRRARIEPSLEAARAKLAERYSMVPEAAIRIMAEHGTRELGDGRRQWKFDPLHQSRGPQPFYVQQGEAFWRRVTCPILYVEGSASFLRLHRKEVDARLGMLRARPVTVEGSGHHPHLEKPEALSSVLLGFLPR